MALQNFRAYNFQIIIQALITSIVSIILIIFFNFGITGALIGSVSGLLLFLVLWGESIDGNDFYISIFRS